MTDIKTLTTARQMLSVVDDAIGVNMTTDRSLLVDIAELKTQIKRACEEGDTKKARNVTERAVAILRTGEASKE